MAGPEDHLEDARQAYEVVCEDLAQGQQDEVTYRTHLEDMLGALLGVVGALVRCVQDVKGKQVQDPYWPAAIELCAMLGIDAGVIDDDGLPSHGATRVDVIAGALRTAAEEAVLRVRSGGTLR